MNAAVDPSLVVDVLNAERNGGAGSVGHACEYETAMMLHLHPERVQMDKARRDIGQLKLKYFNWDHPEPSAYAWQDWWSRFSAEGICGDAAAAIMTTDTVSKTAVRQADGWTIGAMAKGAGMLAPGLATMLVVITTDAVLTAEQADAALRTATHVSFDRLDSDGCMSTNDQVTLLASGASGVTPDLDRFGQELADLCAELARKLQADAEGASHDITIEVRSAATEADALEVGRSVARNNLFLRPRVSI